MHLLVYGGAGSWRCWQKRVFKGSMSEAEYGTLCSRLMEVVKIRILLRDGEALKMTGAPTTIIKDNRRESRCLKVGL